MVQSGRNSGQRERHVESASRWGPRLFFQAAGGLLTQIERHAGIEKWNKFRLILNQTVTSIGPALKIGGKVKTVT